MLEDAVMVAFLVIPYLVVLFVTIHCQYQNHRLYQVCRCILCGLYIHAKFVQIIDLACFPGTTGPDLPYVIVGDEAFSLKDYMLRPYPGRNLPSLGQSYGSI